MVGYSPHETPNLNNMVLKEICFYQKIYEGYFYVQIKIISRRFFNICIKRKVEIKKLDKLPKLDNNYLLFITNYQDVEIIPDISLLIMKRL